MTTQTSNIAPAIELTPAELELIRIKREEQKLQDEKKAAEVAKKHEDAIAQGEKRMKEDKDRSIRLEDASIAFLKELNALAPGEYGLQRKTEDKNYELYDWENRGEKNVYYTNSQKLMVTTIVHTPSGAKLEAHDYFQSSGGSWSRNSKYVGIRFKLTGTRLFDRKNDHLKSADMINDKIQAAWESRQREEKKEKEKLDGFAWLTEHVSNIHPDATVEEKEESGTHSYGRRSWIPGQRFIQATFSSGLVLNYFYDTKEVEGQQVFVAVRRINIAGLSEDAKNEIVAQYAQ